MRFTDDVIEALVSGGVGVAGAYLFLNESQGSIRFFDLISLPIPVAIGIAVGGGSLIASQAHDWLLPYINKSQRMSNIGSALLQLGISGAGTAAILIYGAKAPVSNLPNMFILGSGSAIAGEYIYTKFISGKSNILF